MSYFNFSKKVFAAFSALALLVTGCNSKSSTTPEDPEPDPVPEVKHFTLSADDITAGSCVLNVVRDDPSQPFFYAVVSIEEFETFGDDVQSRAAGYLQGLINWWIEDWGDSEEDAVSYSIYNEDVVDEEIEYLYGATDYILFAGYVDEKGKPTGNFEYIEFSTVTPDPSNNTFMINIDECEARSVTYTVTPTIDDEPYAYVVEKYEDYKGLTDAEIAHKLIKEKYGYYIAFEHGESVHTANIYGGTEYAIFVFGLDDSHSVATTAIYKEVFTSKPAGDPSQLTFTADFAAGDVNGYTLNFTVTPSDDTVNYFVELVDDSWTVEEFTETFKKDIAARAEKSGLDLKTFMEYQSKYGVYNYTYSVYPGQKYKVAVIPIDVNNGTFPCNAIFSETYAPVEPAQGTATAEVTVGKYYDGDAIVELDPNYYFYAGLCIFKIDVACTGAKYYFGLYQDNGETYSRDDIIAKLVENGSSWAYELQIPFDTDGIIYAVAIDEDGNPGPVSELKVNFSKDGCSPASEYFDNASYAPKKADKVSASEPKAKMKPANVYTRKNSPVSFK